MVTVEEENVRKREEQGGKGMWWAGMLFNISLQMSQLDSFSWTQSIFVLIVIFIYNKTNRCDMLYYVSRVSYKDVVTFMLLIKKHISGVF